MITFGLMLLVLFRKTAKTSTTFYKKNYLSAVPCATTQLSSQETLSVSNNSKFNIWLNLYFCLFCSLSLTLSHKQNHGTSRHLSSWFQEKNRPKDRPTSSKTMFYAMYVGSTWMLHTFTHCQVTMLLICLNPCFIYYIKLLDLFYCSLSNPPLSPPPNLAQNNSLSMQGWCLSLPYFAHAHRDGQGRKATTST